LRRNVLFEISYELMQKKLLSVTDIKQKTITTDDINAVCAKNKEIIDEKSPWRSA
jgi:hypothetical protein